MIRCAFTATAALAVALVFGVSTALAATPAKSPLARVAAHDGVSAPPALAHAIKQKLAVAPRAASPLAPSEGSGSAQQQELQASDGMPLDLLGFTVSLSADGHTALVGAPGRIVGAAYVFAEHAGKWTEQQELQSPAGSAQDSYGWSVAIAGDAQTALVGAWSANGIIGTVYWYSLQGGTYVLGGQINPPDGAPDDEFGESVSLSGLGNVALIGAVGHNGFQGAAYVFVHAGGSWKEVREYQDPVAPGEGYGFSVSESADGLVGVVGAPEAQLGQGAAYAFSELDSSQQALVANPSAPPTYLFGVSVSSDALGQRLLVGSPSANLGDGAAYVFQKGRSGWTQSQELVQSDPSGADLFGYSVALDYPGNVAVIGAPERNGTDGAAYAFAGVARLTQQRELTDPAAAGQGDEYGASAAIDALGDELLIGAPYTNNAQGAAWAVENPIG